MRTARRRADEEPRAPRRHAAPRTRACDVCEVGSAALCSSAKPATRRQREALRAALLVEAASVHGGRRGRDGVRRAQPRSSRARPSSVGVPVVHIPTACRRLAGGWIRRSNVDSEPLVRVARHDACETCRGVRSGRDRCDGRAETRRDGGFAPSDREPVDASLHASPSPTRRAIGGLEGEAGVARSATRRKSLRRGDTLSAYKHMKPLIKFTAVTKPSWVLQRNGVLGRRV